jgi:hypothetical protein
MIDELAGGGWRCERKVRVMAGCLAIAVLAGGCGGDDDAQTPAAPISGGSMSAAAATTPPDAGQLSGEGDASPGATGAPVDDESAGTTGAPVDDESAGTTGETAGGAPSAVELGDCPAADAVSSAWGRAFALDESAAMTGAIGLVFCPYVEVIAPGTTDQWGLEPSGEFFSITMTNQDPVIDDPTADRVEGLGEGGTWHPGAGELAVWSDGRGVIVSVPFTPDDIDAFQLATALAGLTLGIDADAASVTPADPDDVAAAAAEQAAGCPDPGDVGAAAGRELVLADGAIAEGGEGMCPYLAAGDDAYSFTVNIGLSRDDFYPIEADEPTEEIAGLGDRAVWQPGYHLLIVWHGDGRVSVQVSGTDLSDDDERAVAIAIAEGLV